MNSIDVCYHPIYSQLRLPGNHRFPITKYEKLYNRLKLESHFVVNWKEPEAVTLEHLYVHDPKYLDQFLTQTLSEKAIKRIGFPLSKLLVERTLYAVGGTLAAAKSAIDSNRASANITGGYHHAHRNFGSGFCIINDLAVTARWLIDQGFVDKVLIFDCDVHQGDGTAAITSSMPDIFTCSIHCAKNFPARKFDSDLDVELDNGTSDEEYLSIVDDTLHMAYRLSQPDLILYDAGADIFIDDELGHLNVSLDGVYKRDKIVAQFARNSNTPLACVTGGGYQRDIDSLVNVHLQLFKALAADVET